MKEIKVLHIVPKLDVGGIESMLYNYFLEIKKYDIKWDFVVHGNEVGKIESEMLKLGCKVFHVQPKRESLSNYFKTLSFIMKNGKYDIVHAHQNNYCFISLALAKYYKIKIRIAHSHTCQSSIKNRSIKEKIYVILNNYFSTNLAFCGKDAGQWAFGNNMSGKWIKNGLNIHKYKFNIQWKKELCDTYKIGDKTIVLGMVCRLSPEKNIGFSIELMKRLNQNGLKKYKLFVLGDGELSAELKKRVINDNLSTSVFFLGRKDDVYRYYSFFDVFLLPSFFEGSPVSLIEAQCSNLYSIVSDTISDETFINDNVFKIGISEESISEWTECLESFVPEAENRIYNSKLDIFNIKKLSKELFDFYVDLIRENN